MKREEFSSAMCHSSPKPTPLRKAMQEQLLQRHSLSYCHDDFYKLAVLESLSFDRLDTSLHIMHYMGGYGSNSKIGFSTQNSWIWLREEEEMSVFVHDLGEGNFFLS